MPIIGNGNVSSYQEAERMMEETGCDAVMIARAAIRNPWIFNGFTSSHDRILSMQMSVGNTVVTHKIIQ